MPAWLNAHKFHLTCKRLFTECSAEQRMKFLKFFRIKPHMRKFDACAFFSGKLPLEKKMLWKIKEWEGKVICPLHPNKLQMPFCFICGPSKWNDAGSLLIRRLRDTKCHLFGGSWNYNFHHKCLHYLVVVVIWALNAPLLVHISFKSIA